jgi:translation initiation factor eIF-2B subunit delta
MSDPSADKAALAAAKAQRALEFKNKNPELAAKEAAKKQAAAAMAAPTSAPAPTPAPAPAPAAAGDAAAEKAAAAAAKAQRALEFQNKNPALAAKEAAKKQAAAAPAPAPAAVASSATDAEAEKAAAAAAKAQRALEFQNKNPALAAKEAAKKQAPAAAAGAAGSSASPAKPVANESPATAQPAKARVFEAIPALPALLPPSMPAFDERHAEELHPRILELGVLFEHRRIIGTNARTVALIESLREAALDFLRRHHDPTDLRLTQDLDRYLKTQVDFIGRCWTLTPGIRFMLRRVTRGLQERDPTVSIGASDINGVFGRALQAVRDEVRDTAREAAQLMHDGDVILTYGRSAAIELALCSMRDSSVRLGGIIIVDDGPLYEGRLLLRRLRLAGVEGVSYCTLATVCNALARCNKVFIGASAVMHSGHVLTRAGTAMVALAARNQGKPVFCVCESYKFTAEMFVNTQRGVNGSVAYDVCPPNTVEYVVTSHEVHQPNGIAAVIRMRDQATDRRRHAMSD